jgi:hypothetical protein
MPRKIATWNQADCNNTNEGKQQVRQAGAQNQARSLNSERS